MHGAMPVTEVCLLFVSFLLPGLGIASPQTEYLPRRYPWVLDEDVGYVPADLSPLSQILWWSKRFPPTESGSDDNIDDLFLQTSDEENEIHDLSDAGSVKKRDYTAAQLLSMLKQLAKSRRHRQIRIAGKGLRFGISKK